MIVDSHLEHLGVLSLVITAAIVDAPLVLAICSPGAGIAITGIGVIGTGLRPNISSTLPDLYRSIKPNAPAPDNSIPHQTIASNRFGDFWPGAAV